MDSIPHANIFNSIDQKYAPEKSITHEPHTKLFVPSLVNWGFINLVLESHPLLIVILS